MGDGCDWIGTDVVLWRVVVCRCTGVGVGVGDGVGDAEREPLYFIWPNATEATKDTARVTMMIRVIIEGLGVGLLEIRMDSRRRSEIEKPKLIG